MTSPTKRALVLGGGGITGIAWETGIVAGLVERGVDLHAFERFVGTSAGSVVAAQVATRSPMKKLFAAQVAPVTPGAGAAAVTKLLIARFIWAGLLSRGKPLAYRQRIGRLSLSKTTPPAAEWLGRFESMLPVHTWPENELRVVVVHAKTGEPRVLDRHAGVALPTAVAASCAVPGVWAPVVIEGEPYMDGGFRSVVNADLADGCDEVLVVAPLTRNLGPMEKLRAQIERLRQKAKVTLIKPDDAALKAIGPNVLDASRRALAAQAGYAQAQGVVL
jgi:NTE family protein